MSAYQIALLGDGRGTADTLRETLRRRCGDLGIPESSIVFLDDGTIQTRDPKAPIVAVFLGLDTMADEARGDLAELVDSGTPVIPVVRDLGNFTRMVPTALQKLNGMVFDDADDPDLDRIASVVLENLHLLRKSRRLFISYRRTDARDIAGQLYDLLDAQGFDVFLDTHSIRPGDDFQKTLWHRLADTDVVVLLDSPGFMQSRWTVEELTKASSTSIQILQILWPSEVMRDAVAFSIPHRLASNDFVDSRQCGDGAKLTAQTLAKLAVEVESLRARAMAARHAYLVREFVRAANDVGLTPQLQPGRFVQFEIGGNRTIAAVPAVGVPDAVRYHESEIAHAGRHAEVVVVFDARGIRDNWLEHLSWLNGQLHVKSIDVAEASAWLKGLTA